MQSFGPIAAHYDLLMAKVPYAMWLDYYRLLLARQDVTPKSFLDACCGTGTLTEMVHRPGMDVWGFDLSEPMIAEAQRKAAEAGRQIEYRVADASTLALGRTFEAAFSFFDSLNYITDAAAFRAALFRLSEHLEPGGSLIFDLNTAYAFEAKMFDQQSPARGAKIQYRWRGDYDPGTRLIQVTMNFEVRGEAFQEVHIQRAHPHDEVVQNLRDAGFTQIECFESYTLDRPRKRTDRVHYAALRVS